MAAKEELLKRLGDEKTLRETRGPELVSEWQEALTRLFRQFVAWLAEPVASGLLAVLETPVEVHEERLGDYQASSLKIVTPQGETVRVLPKARLVVGGFGRVDLECAPRAAMLVRRERARWQFARLAPDQGGWSFEDLTEESFWSTLQYLLS